jgi:cyclic 2,3-diphosphoglycerate synthase
VLNLIRSQNNRYHRVIALIDGEHYPQVTSDAISVLKENFGKRFAGIIFMGGTEKISAKKIDEYFDEELFAVQDFETDFIKGLAYFKPDLVYDLSDEPVVNYTIRMKIASYCFSAKSSYMGPDFLFDYETNDFYPEIPSVSVIGTGKRIGKTAISAYIAKTLKKEKMNVCIVAMGRGGPREPQFLEGSKIKITPSYLLELSNSGFHASSDYIEDALVSGVNTVGSRRCGGGFGGKVFISNVKEGVLLAQRLKPEIIILEGSGASLPDVCAHTNICVIGANQDWDEIIGYLGIYRIMISEMIVLTMCENPMADKKKIRSFEENIRKINPNAKIFKTVFRPFPLAPIDGKKVLVVTTAKTKIEDKIKKYIEKTYDCQVAGISFHLSDRERLREDLKSFKDYDTILCELKAASVDVVTDFAFHHGIEIIYMNNIPLIQNGRTDFKDNLLKIYKKIKKTNRIE